jgi:hypothetical protein
MTRQSLRFTRFMLLLLGLGLSANPTAIYAQSQISADIQKGNGDKALNANTTLQTKAGDKLTIEIFATSYTDAQGLEVILELSDISQFATVDAQNNYAAGSSPEFAVAINSTSGNQLKLSTVNFGATKSYSGDPQLVATLSLTLSETFTAASIKIVAINFGTAIDPNITFTLTPPLNNLVNNVSVTQRHSSAKLTFRTKHDGIDNTVSYRVQGATDWLPAQTTLQASTSADLIAAVKALRTAGVNIQRATPTAVAAALTAANIADTSDTFIAAIKVFDAALSSRIHEANITGLTADTQYEYEIVATGINGDLSPTKTGTFKTRLSPDVRPAAISNINTSVTDKRVEITWRTNRSSTTQYKIYTRDASGVRGSLVTESATPSTTNGSTSHRATLQNLTSATEYEYELSTRLIGVDDLITESLMTEAQVTATETRVFKTRGNLPPIEFTRFQKITTGTNSAQITTYANQPVTVFVDYGVHTVGRPSGAVPTGSAFDADPIYPNRVVSTLSQGIHILDLTGLEAKTRYRYRVTAYPLEAVATLPTPVASSSPRAGADIVLGNRGDSQNNSGDLSVAGSSGGSVAVELYGTGYQDVSGFTATLELTNPSAVQSITMTPGSTFPIKLSDPAINGNIVTASLGLLGSASAPGSDLTLLGTVVINLTSDIGIGLGVTVKTITFASSTTQDVVTPNAVLTATGSGSAAFITTDPRGKTKINRDFIFQTKNTVPAPQITRGPSVRAGRNTAWLSVTTNVPTTLSFSYGTVTTLGTADEIQLSSLDQYGNPRTSKSHRVALRGLTPNTAYKFRMEFTNTNGETLIFPSPATKGVATKFQVTGGDGGFGTNDQVDATNPLITSGPTIVATTQNSLTIAWKTDEPATSAISYGTSATALNDQASDGESVLSHQITLTGLNTNTNYAFQVGSTDLSGNGPSQSTVAFGTTLAQADLTAPTITTAPALLYASDAVAEIKWNTDELSTGEFNFGIDAANLDQSRSLTEDAIDHVISLTGLTVNTTYFYQVAMNDANGNGPTNSAVLSFQTAAAADAQAPTISAVAATPLETSAIITWKTDEIADGVVKFGTDAAALTGNVGDIESITDHRIILSNLIASTNYTFLVQSTDRTGNGPAESTATTFTTQATGTATGPAAPADLAARAGNGAIQLTWAAPTTDATSIVLERAEGDGAFAPITTLDIVTGFLDNNVQNGTAYRYQISANGIQGAGTPSTATSAVTPSEISGPSAPSLSGIQGTKASPTLVINNSTPVVEGDVLTYTFQLSTASDFSDVVTLQTLASGAGRGASDPATITLYTVDRELTDGVTYYYRVKANDGFSDSPFLSGSFTVNTSAPAYPGDFNGDLKVGFPDFLTFIGTFNKKLGDEGYNGDADLTSDGVVNFPDFLAFVAVFNKVYAAGKPVVAVQFDTDTQAQFSLNGRFVQNNADRELAVDVQLKDVTDLKGYGIQVNYDPTVLEFINATDEGDTFLKSGDRSADIFAVLDHNKETGALYIASAVTQGNPVSGAGTLGTLTFRLLDPNRQDTDIHIAQGILFNPTLDGFIAINLGDRFSLIPTEFALEHNFPNPFNPETTLRYAIPNAGQVTLSIYNVLGQEVVQLVNAEQMPGFYNISWNGKDALGHTVASGVYLYRIQAGDFHQTHKMLLLK